MSRIEDGWGLTIGQSTSLRSHNAHIEVVYVQIAVARENVQLG